MKPHEKCMIPPGLLSRLAYLLQEVHDTSRFIIREVSVINVWVVGVNELDMCGGGEAQGQCWGAHRAAATTHARQVQTRHPVATAAHLPAHLGAT